MAAVWAMALAAAAHAQQAGLPMAPVPSVAGVRVETPTAGVMRLSLDEAIGLGLKSNLQLVLDQADERNLRGQVLTVANNLLPSLSASAQTNAQEVNLAAMGFKPQNFPKQAGIAPGSIKTIVKVNTTSAQLNLSQQLFNLQAYEFYRAAQDAVKVAGLEVLNSRGNVVLAVGTEYLQALADAAEIANAQALLAADEEVLRQATASHDAGVGTNFDVLRARVQAQQQEQALVRAENQFAKQKIELNRTMGLPAQQQLELTDTVPYAEFAGMPLEDAKALAYSRRKDYLELLAQIEVAERSAKAVRYGRLPTLAVGGYYGVLGETTGLYHGVFAAQGRLNFPIFQEAALRGEREVAEARLGNLRSRVNDLRVTIEAQLRASRLDVESSQQLVEVAKSNVDLAGQELADTRDRYVAGVDDILPVTQAQAALAAAQSRLVEAEFGYNQAKLNLARNTGVIEGQYKSYLGQ